MYKVGVFIKKYVKCLTDMTLDSIIVDLQL